jgi:murein DD-endopeptidase MepM/ murein hydrolase activator NlpD
MDSFLKVLLTYAKEPIAILDGSIPWSEYIPLDLSTSNAEIELLDITHPVTCQDYIHRVLKRSSGRIAYGGYLEKRNLYADKASFSDNLSQQRNIHLGIDYWSEAGTSVLVPLAGTVHSFKNNSTIGDYGPTIILEHQLHGHTFYTLYGHLSLESLEGLYVGKQFKACTVLAKLGTPDINVNYAPHLHFQIIRDMQGNMGDYPGVAKTLDLDYYKENCPDPDILLKIAY